MTRRRKTVLGSLASLGLLALSLFSFFGVWMCADLGMGAPPELRPEYSTRANLYLGTMLVSFVAGMIVGIKTYRSWRGREQGTVTR
jgi:hypothetical protein